MAKEADDVQPGRRISRRRALGTIGAATAIAGAAIAVRRSDAIPAPSTDGDVVAFHGEHQAGVVTPAQGRLEIAAFDLTTDRIADVRELLRAWTDAAALMTAGRPVGPTDADPLLPPPDTGEAVGLPAARLTLTFGLGPTLFDVVGEDRFGLASRRPAALADLPPLAGDELDPGRSGGDLVVQACADDPQVAFHAIRNLARVGRGLAAIRWSQLGFSRTSSAGRVGPTPRNLQGFKDGTNNLDAADATVMDADVWVPNDATPAWMRGGTYLVTRRIQMLIETWDRTSMGEQESTIGRRKESGAPLGRTHEFDPVPLAAKDASGEPVIPLDAHVRLAAPSENGGAAILRRGYSFTDGIDPVTGELDAGLFFICFQRDPRTQFVRVQRHLSRHDALNEYIKHVGSGIFAIPPGTDAGGYVGETLLG